MSHLSIVDICLWLFVAHSPDNSFMGFVVERHVPTPTASTSNVSSIDAVKKNQAVVYGKAEYMWSVSQLFTDYMPRVGCGAVRIGPTPFPDRR